jgi:hypothetical protein
MTSQCSRRVKSLAYDNKTKLRTKKGFFQVEIIEAKSALLHGYLPEAYDISFHPSAT